MLEEQIREAIAAAIEKLYGEQARQAAKIELRIPPAEFGDLSTPVALSLRKTVGVNNPLELAEQIASALREAHSTYVAGINVSKPGFINITLDYAAYARDVFGSVLAEGKTYGNSETGNGTKVVIEHTNVNPNKAPHVGHLRNACLGDAISRTLRRLGYSVEVQNYIDDTGVQVADILVGFLYLGAKYNEYWEGGSNQPFDYFCSELYVKVQQAYEQNPELKQRRVEVLQAIERGDNDIARLAKEITTRVVRDLLGTMSRMNIFYDLLTWESDILHLGFWRHAFEMLKSRGLIVYETEGKNKGTWVVKYGSSSDYENEEGVQSEDKVLVKSDGVATYTAKDIAYQLWKFGLLGLDFFYHPWGEQDNGEMLWTGTSNSSEGQAMDRFGHANRVINVIDQRQSYPQAVLKHTLAEMGFTQAAENSIHLAYEVVALSAEAARSLGIPVEGEGPVALSGRRGIEVKIGDLYDMVKKRLMEKAQSPEVAAGLTIAALKHYMLKYGLNSIITFDFDEALSANGKTGVYLENAYARGCNILRKAAGIEVLPGGETQEAAQDFESYTPNEVEQKLVRQIAILPGELRRTGELLAPSVLAEYAFALAAAFTDFYEHTEPIIRMEEGAARRFRVMLVRAFVQTMANTLDALGIPALGRI